MFPSEDHSSNYNPTAHNEPGTNEMAYVDDYNPDDYTQDEKNAGQRKINYALTVVDYKLAKALKALTEAIATLPAAHNLDLNAVNEAIKEAVETSHQVAGIKPPGCDPSWPQ